MQRIRTHATNRFRRHCLKVWHSRGGGFYGFVVLLTFLYLEGIDLAGDIAQLPGSHPGLGFIIGWVVSNLVEAVVNSIRAALWPLAWVQQFGLGFQLLAILAGCYVGYRAVRPTVVRWLTPTDQPMPLPDRPLA